MLFRVIFGAAGCGVGTALVFHVAGHDKNKVLASEVKSPVILKSLPTRQEQLSSLKSDEFDVVVIGGGATGAGIALDSTTRGLKTALIEFDDFSSGTSSRSTKLLHGGVRYLQKAIMGLDYEQYHMVKEALNERANLLQVAPHLSEPLPIMLPVYKWWQVPYFWFGIKMYDLVAGSKCLKSSYLLSKSKALELFPMLKKDKLCGAIVYYDGLHNDARMNVSIAITAARCGATVCNHTSVTGLLKNSDSRVEGVKVKNELTGEEWNVKAKCVINATGPFSDSVRLMDAPDTRKLVQPSMGVHIVLPDYYSPESMGLLDPSTSDGRVIFFLPWQNHTIAGTTDTPCEVTHSPSPTEFDIQFILNEVKNYLTPDIEVRRGDVLSAWAGIRPLAIDPSKTDTQSIARNHVIEVSSSGLLSISGGKWTTYRSMASEAVDAAVKECKLSPTCPSRTEGLYLEGGANWTPTMFIRLVQDFGLETEIAKHLSQTYGDRAFSVAKLSRLTGKRWPVVGNKLHEEFPYIEAEVRYAVREYACTAIDVLARRTRLAFLNVQAAQEALPEIVNIMGSELKWSKEEKDRQKKTAEEFLLKEMGLQAHTDLKKNLPISLTKEEMGFYIKQFRSLDKDNKSYISVNDLRNILKTQGHKVSGENLHEILKEVDVNQNGKIELEEFLQMMSAVKSGTVTNTRLVKLAEWEQEEQGRISVERSGGGL